MDSGFFPTTAPMYLGSEILGIDARSYTDKCRLDSSPWSPRCRTLWDPNYHTMDDHPMFPSTTKPLHSESKMLEIDARSYTDTCGLDRSQCRLYYRTSWDPRGHCGHCREATDHE